MEVCIRSPPGSEGDWALGIYGAVEMLEPRTQLCDRASSSARSRSDHSQSYECVPDAPDSPGPAQPQPAPYAPLTNPTHQRPLVQPHDMAAAGGRRNSPRNVYTANKKCFRSATRRQDHRVGAHVQYSDADDVRGAPGGLCWPFWPFWPPGNCEPPGNPEAWLGGRDEDGEGVVEDIGAERQEGDQLQNQTERKEKIRRSPGQGLCTRPRRRAMVMRNGSVATRSA